MPGRLRQLRLSFGMDQPAMAELVGCSIADWSAWEAGHVPADLPSVARRTGVSLGWLEGLDVPVAGRTLRDMQAYMAEALKQLSDEELSALRRATTGERIAHVINLMRVEQPDLLPLPVIAGWLGLSLQSTEQLLEGELDPEPTVIARSSEMTGVPERWFRFGPDQ